MPKGLPRDSETARARAEALFKRRQDHGAEAPLAWAEYKAAQERVSERTRKLRELRLSRENRAADGKDAVPARPR